MRIRRTANAGILLELDGVSILLDGVSQEVNPYLATPVSEIERLTADLPDALVYTHSHYDHYDPDFAIAYQAKANGVIIGPTDLPGCCAIPQTGQIGPVLIESVKTRHIGKVGEMQHFSYVISGSKCVWFLGDASPLQWRYDGSLPKPDVLVAPFAYAATQSAWGRTKELGARYVFLVHMPDKENDPAMLWKAVTEVTDGEREVQVFIPKLQETVILFEEDTQ